MEDIILFDNQSYVRASSALADQRTRVIKDGEAFGVYDVFGDIKHIGLGAHGLYKEATRYLSHFEFRIQGRAPLFLSSTIRSDNSLFTADLSNSDFVDHNGKAVLKGLLHIERSKFLYENACYEQVLITNFGHEPYSFDVSFRYRSDFADMFEIRGLPRTKQGEMLKPEVNSESVTFAYCGADRKERRCLLHFHPQPKELTPTHSTFHVDLAPQQKAIFFVTGYCLEEQSAISGRALSFESAFSALQGFHDRISTGETLIKGSSGRFTGWVERSRSDIHLMVTETSSGPYPYAGIPWFNAVFGRDGIITALQYLWINPQVAHGVLCYLSMNQAKESIPEQDAEPGKILHEFRRGEMVETGEVPFKRYYGSADATPLFVILAGEYLKVTADISFLKELWPSIEAALTWMNKYGDLDGDGFVEYSRKTPQGLLHQGWKDSIDPISHKDGTLAEGPIALCEVQAYVYGAKVAAAFIAEKIGLSDRSKSLLQEAARFKERFQDAFWDEEMGSFVLALDGKKEACQVLSSNAAHCLFAGIASEAHARKTVERLCSKEMMTDWGIRTLSENAVRYNPMSYHNGSIWPHDNAIAAEGFARYGHKDAALQILTSLFSAAMQVDLYRLPELFCGFERRPGEGPTLYPVACSPQSWAAGATFLLIKAVLGLELDAFNKEVTLRNPVLPDFLSELSIENLKVASGSVDLALRRYNQDVSVFVSKRRGDIKVNIIK